MCIFLFVDGSIKPSCVQQHIKRNGLCGITLVEYLCLVQYLSGTWVPYPEQGHFGLGQIHGLVVYKVHVRCHWCNTQQAIFKLSLSFIEIPYTFYQVFFQIGSSEVSTIDIFWGYLLPGIILLVTKVRSIHFLQGSRQIAKLSLLGKVGIHIDILQISVFNVLDQHIVERSPIRTDFDGIRGVVQRKINTLVQVYYLPYGLGPENVPVIHVTIGYRRVLNIRLL